MVSDLKSNLITTTSQRGPNVQLKGNSAVDCFIVVVQNLGFGNSRYIILRSRIRAISYFGFLVVLFSYVECASTHS